MKSHHLTSATLQDLQAEMLRLLGIIDTVCRKNNIEYWLDSGTLLGAIRHKGFIPWDDDIDISVPAESYHQLLNALDKESKISKDFFLYCKSNSIPRDFEKLMSTKMMVRTPTLRTMNACFIDIFPARMIKKSDFKRDQDISNTVTYLNGGRPKKGVKIDNKYVKYTPKCSYTVRKNLTNYFHFEYIPDCNYRESDGIITTYTLRKSDVISSVLYTDIFPLRDVFFEGIKTFAPNNYEKYLKILYGNYMVIPLKSKQVQKHSTEIFFCNSGQFARESTAKNLIKHSQSSVYFYLFAVRRFLMWLKIL